MYVCTYDDMNIDMYIKQQWFTAMNHYIQLNHQLYKQNVSTTIYKSIPAIFVTMWYGSQ